jgi:hypothetical protein
MNSGLRISAICGLMSCALALQGLAQTKIETPPPTSPFIAPIPEFADWTVVTTHANSSGKSPSAPEEAAKPFVIQTVRTKEIRKQRTTLPGGEAVEVWMLGTLFFTTSENGRVAISDLMDNIGFEPASLNAFPGFSWLNIANYRGTRTVEKGTYYYFAQSGKEAWIDIQSKLPFALADDSGYTRYTFSTPPTASLMLPTAMQQRYDRFARLMQRVNKIAEDARRQ